MSGAQPDVRAFRKVEESGRWWLGGRRSTYEVVARPGVVVRVGDAELPRALGVTGRPGRDLQECLMCAAALFRESSDRWVQYPYGGDVGPEQAVGR